MAPATGLAEVGGGRVPYLRDEDVEGQGRKGKCVPLSHSDISIYFTPALIHMCSCENLELLDVTTHCRPGSFA